MARIRTIKPAFFSSLTVAAQPVPTRLTFAGLWCYVDDAGRGVDDARLIKAEIWPLDDSYTTRKVEADLKRLTDAGLIERYEAGGRRYLRVVNFGEHQRINRPQPSKLPAPQQNGSLTDGSLNDHGTDSEPDVSDHGSVTEDSPPEGKGRELPPQPPAERGEPDVESAHHGQHRNCRACGTNQRGPTTPTTSSEPVRVTDDGRPFIPGIGVATGPPELPTDPDPDPDGTARAAARAALRQPGAQP